MNIILLGLPGSGKGTQATLLSKKLGLFYLQTGDLARTIAKTNLKVRRIVESGGLIPESVMTKNVIDRLEKNVPCGDNILFEGYPRFEKQYQKLREYLEKKGKKIDALILLDISKKEAVKRLSKRRICSKCGRVYNIETNPPNKNGTCECGGKLVLREDDKPKAIKVRFDAYIRNTKEVITAAKKDGILIVVDGERKIERIYKDIIVKLKQSYGK